ncbi:unnamed protein product [Dovyalis caffra]|uniref:Uncharacterized protein n=1 Tax=Dovyalis caffra TaxID=77055 RepID=A0AAV1SQP2_9ROSI|nr:unnamed protein product [Dovyalis caffra]
MTTTTFLVLFLLGEVKYLEQIIEGSKVFGRVMDRLHQEDSKEILTEMDIPKTKYSKILDEIASKAHGMNTYSGSFMSIRMEKVIFRLVQNTVSNEEDVARADGKSMDE